MTAETVADTAADASAAPADASAEAADASAAPADASAEPMGDEPMGADRLDRSLEALLMVADEPLPIIALATAVHQPVKAVRASVLRLVADFDGDAGGVRRGFELREVGGGWRIYVRADHDALVTDFVLDQSPTKLSQAALETLAVIAYKQPVTRGQVSAIRAVNVDSVVRTLLARGLITESFTDAETGAIHYVTTDLVLQLLGLNSLDDLPKISPLLDDGADGFEGF